MAILHALHESLGVLPESGDNLAFFGSLAQLVEQRTFNPLVAGSNPARPTTNLLYQMKALRVIVTPFFVSAAVRSFTYCAVLVTRSSPSTTAA